jgi:ribosome-binding factor A
MARSSGGAAAGMPSQRQLRVGELVRHALADMLSRGIVRDPELERVLVTIAEVRVSADLRHATAYVTLMGNSEPDRTIKALNRNARFIRGQISPALRQMKYMPDLQFIIDTRFDDDGRIDQLLKSEAVSRDLDQPDETDEGSGE